MKLLLFYVGITKSNAIKIIVKCLHFVVFSSSCSVLVFICLHYLVTLFTTVLGYIPVQIYRKNMIMLLVSNNTITLHQLPRYVNIPTLIYLLK